MFKIKAEMLDGKQYEAEVSLFMPTADRLAFERHFGLSFINAAKQWGENAEGALEEWLAWAAWRTLTRSKTAVPAWSIFIEDVANTEIAEVGSETVDPTDPTPQPG